MLFCKAKNFPYFKNDIYLVCKFKLHQYIIWWLNMHVQRPGWGIWLEFLRSPSFLVLSVMENSFRSLSLIFLLHHWTDDLTKVSVLPPRPEVAASTGKYGNSLSLDIGRHCLPNTLQFPVTLPTSFVGQITIHPLILIKCYYPTNRVKWGNIGPLLLAAHTQRYLCEHHAFVCIQGRGY